MGPCAVQNATAPSTPRGKSGKVHWDSGFGHTSVFFVELPYIYPVTTKIRGPVKKRDLKILHTVPNIHFFQKFNLKEILHSSEFDFLNPI